MTKATKTKTRWMWVHYGTEPVKAKVFWSRNGLAVTRVGKEELSLTHVMTGNRILPTLVSQLGVKGAIKVARVVAPLYPWSRLSFHTIINKAKAMGKRSSAVLVKAGLAQKVTR